MTSRPYWQDYLLDRIDKYQLAKQTALTLGDAVEVELHEAVLNELQEICRSLGCDTINN